MQKLEIGMTPHKGFTLIEILIVIVIIGITIGFALVAFGDFGESKRIRFAAEQLLNTIKLSQQKAILESSTLGLKLDKSSYQILKFVNNKEWKPISNQGIFKIHYLPSHTVLHLKKNGNSEHNSPDIILMPSGDMTLFTLDFGSNSEQSITRIIGSSNGDLELNSARSE